MRKERKGKEWEGMEWGGKVRNGKERNGKERKRIKIRIGNGNGNGKKNRIHVVKKWCYARTPHSSIRTSVQSTTD